MIDNMKDYRKQLNEIYSKPNLITELRNFYDRNDIEEKLLVHRYNDISKIKLIDSDAMPLILGLILGIVNVQLVKKVGTDLIGSTIIVLLVIFSFCVYSWFINIGSDSISHKVELELIKIKLSPKKEVETLQGEEN